MANGILDGIRILDFTRVLAGPYATRILADFGAEVIKVQSKKTATGAESNDGGYFCMWNRNKKSALLDMDHPEGIEVIMQLTAISDVVMENFSSRVMSNFGLNYEQLRKVKPDIIMASMSGMGHSGPWQNHVAYGQTVQAFGGLNYLTSFDKDAPLGIGNAYGDPVVGMYGAFAVLAALEYRDRTGKGQEIDISGYEAMCTAIGPALMDVFANDTEMQPEGNTSGYVNAGPYGCYRCKGDDRWCVIAVFTEDQWTALVRAMGSPDWAGEERFSFLENRKANAADMDGLIEQWTSGLSPEDVEKILQDAGVPSGVVQNSKDLANDPHLQARDFFVHLDHPLLGDTISDATPINFIENQRESWKSSPQLGEDNRYVYMDLLGFSEDKLKEYIDKGIIG